MIVEIERKKKLKSETSRRILADTYTELKYFVSDFFLYTFVTSRRIVNTSSNHQQTYSFYFLFSSFAFALLGFKEDANPLTTFIVKIIKSTFIFPHTELKLHPQSTQLMQINISFPISSFQDNALLLSH